MSLVLRTRVLLGIVLFGFAVADSASACSVCIAGDQLYSSQGATAQAEGDVSAFFEVRGWRKTSGALPGEHAEEPAEGAAPEPPGKERNRGTRADLYLSATPLDRITLTVDLPWVWNEITEIEGGTSATLRIEGFGDMSANVSAVLWRNRDVLPSTWVEARGFVKFPTGESSRSVDGVKDPHLQVGTGATDFGFGAAGVHKLDWALVYASASYRINTKGSLHYEYGDVALANAAVAVPLGHALGVPALTFLTPGLELNYRWADYDRFRGTHYHDSGGSILYFTPSLRVTPPWFENFGRISLRAAVQLPITSRWLNGFQKEHPIWFAGIQYAY